MEKPIQSIDIAIKAKWILIEQGLAATKHLIQKVQMGGGTYTNPSNGKTYRLPTAEECINAFIRASKEGN